MPKLKIEFQDEKIISHIRGIPLVKTPEELVRQEFVCMLVNDLGYKIEQMEEEKNLTENSDRGTGKASADILIFKSEADKLEGKNAFITIECKADYLTLTEKDYYQGANYARWSGSSILVVTNGSDNRYFKIHADKLPYSKSPISNIPHASIINDSQKLEDELIKTTTMTRDEFMNLLLKCHNIIRNNDKLSPEAAFDEISKILFIKIRYERSNKNKIFSLENYKNTQAVFKESGITKPAYQQLFEQTKQEFQKDNLFEATETLRIRENSFESILTELQQYDLSNTSDDVKGIAFEKFLGRTFRGELGQFFTPRTLVDFMVEVLDPQEDELVCDPACGSGGFLIKAFEYMRSHIEEDVEIRKEAIQKKYFGEAPKVKDIHNITTEEKKQLAEFQKKITDAELEKKAEKELSEIEKELHLSLDKEKIETRLDKLSKTRLFGTDANPRMARVSKMNMIMHGDGHGGVHHNDGLLNVNGIFEDRFDIILANPPFGSRVPKDLKITQADIYTDEVKKQAYIKKYGDKYLKALQQVEGNIGKKLIDIYDVGKFSTLTEVLFMERCLRLLRKGGRMGIVLPEGVLNNSNLQKVRNYFEGRAKILLITSIPQDVFVASGATVKPSLVFLKKFTEEEELEYTHILATSQDEVNGEFDNDIKKLSVEVKGEKDKEKKKKLKAELKNLETKKDDELRKKVKQGYNYQIAISEIEKAGISTTGSEIENELKPLAEEFTKYRKANKLW